MEDFDLEQQWFWQDGDEGGGGGASTDSPGSGWVGWYIPGPSGEFHI